LDYEHLISLSTATTATKKIDLMTTVPIAPANTAVLPATEVATLDRISTADSLGLGAGGRKDKLDAVHESPKDPNGLRDIIGSSFFYSN